MLGIGEALFTEFSNLRPSVYTLYAQEKRKQSIKDLTINLHSFTVNGNKTNN